ncbi:TadE family protein [Streptomyces sp. PRh5]|uniref:TadE/TadG family type IV pilus assembly protein n=1 Tax=Streptomyces sp. PRh5 TaxID=1158056 RepID=UPI00044661B2|nr:TadE family protein [Streptomyces sp. PRh5]
MTRHHMRARLASGGPATAPRRPSRPVAATTPGDGLAAPGDGRTLPSGGPSGRPAAPGPTAAPDAEPTATAVARRRGGAVDVPRPHGMAAHLSSPSPVALRRGGAKDRWGRRVAAVPRAVRRAAGAAARHLAAGSPRARGRAGASLGELSLGELTGARRLPGGVLARTGPRPGGARRGRADTGSASIEFLGFLPILILVALAAVQLGIAAYAAQQAGTAARAAARTASLDEPRTSPQAAGKAAMSGWLADGASIGSGGCGGGEAQATATVEIPSVIPGFDFGSAERSATMPCDDGDGGVAPAALGGER